MKNRFASALCTLVVAALLLLAGGERAAASGPWPLAERSGQCAGTVAAAAGLSPALPVLSATQGEESHPPSEHDHGGNCHCTCGCQAGGAALFPTSRAGALALAPHALSAPLPPRETPLRPALLPYLLPYAHAPPAGC